MEFRRRQFLTSPGESLLLPHEAMSVADRWARWAKYSALPKSSIVSSPLVAVPLARRAAGASWPAETDPAAFWHPVFWLPGRLSEPTPDESLDIWAVRVALELALSGLYDVETGTWLDVLSTVGLDVDDDVVQARIVEWLSGEPDLDLDRIDLSLGLDLEDLDWSADQAEDLLPLLIPASWAVLSNDLISMAAEAAADDEVDIASLTSATRTILYLAQGSIGEGPAGDTGEAPHALWQRILDDLVNWPHRTLEETVDGPFDALIESLYAIRNDHWVFVEALWENLSEPAVPVGAE